jgi:hypothetical protein
MGRTGRSNSPRRAPGTAMTLSVAMRTWPLPPDAVDQLRIGRIFSTQGQLSLDTEKGLSLEHPAGTWCTPVPLSASPQGCLLCSAELRASLIKIEAELSVPPATMGCS